MRSALLLCWVMGSWMGVRGSPIPDRPLILMSELTSRLDSIGSKIQEQRLPLPTLQEIESIKRVAQILIMLGEQVIPAIIGEPAPGGDRPVSVDDMPNDPVRRDKLLH